jgi:hypothetical protein
MNPAIWGIIAGVVSGPLMWGLLQFWLTRHSRRDEERRVDDERIVSEDQRREMLATAQASAQRVALESANERYSALRDDYQECRDGLRASREETLGIRTVNGNLIQAFEALLRGLRPGADNDTFTMTLTFEQVAEARKAIADARNHFN